MVHHNKGMLHKDTTSDQLIPFNSPDENSCKPESQHCDNWSASMSMFKSTVEPAICQEKSLY